MSLHHFSPAAGRPIDELLACYASGRLSPPLHGLVAAHLSIKPDNRAFVAALEGLIGEEIETLPQGPVRDREARLAAIFGSVEQPVAQPRIQNDGVVPGPLLRLMGCSLADVPWRTRLPGVREFRLKNTGDTEASLMWIRPGRTMPSHTHEGSEYTLVLRGGFTDATGHYRRGDIAIADAEVDHRPRADDDEDCVCFAVTDAPLRLTGRVGRIVQKFLGH